jgi:hypothetical protein
MATAEDVTASVAIAPDTHGGSARTTRCLRSMACVPRSKLIRSMTSCSWPNETRSPRTPSNAGAAGVAAAHHWIHAGIVSAGGRQGPSFTGVLYRSQIYVPSQAYAGASSNL